MSARVEQKEWPGRLAERLGLRLPRAVRLARPVRLRQARPGRPAPCPELWPRQATRVVPQARVFQPVPCPALRHRQAARPVCQAIQRPERSSEDARQVQVERPEVARRVPAGHDLQARLQVRHGVGLPRDVVGHLPGDVPVPEEGLPAVSGAPPDGETHPVASASRVAAREPAQARRGVLARSEVRRRRPAAGPRDEPVAEQVPAGAEQGEWPGPPRAVDPVAWRPGPDHRAAIQARVPDCEDLLPDRPADVVRPGRRRPARVPAPDR